MTKKINLEIATLERVVFSDEVDQITLPTKMGEITILPNHIPVISALAAGEILIKKAPKESRFQRNPTGQEKEEIPLAISGGFLEIQPNKVVILADAAEHTEEIDEKAVEEAKRKAEETLKNREAGREELISAQRALEFAETRIRVIQKRKHYKFKKMPQTE